MDAGRPAAENDVRWHAEGGDLIVASWDVPPERPEVRLSIDADGAVRSVLRWDGQEGYVPMGVDVLEDRRFGEVTILSSIRGGWWYGTPGYEPFFGAGITSAQPR